MADAAREEVIVAYDREMFDRARKLQMTHADWGKRLGVSAGLV